MVLPWVRLHAVKDYVDLPLLLAQTPSVRHTINVVPSLLAQLDAYASGWMDNVEILCRRDPATLTPAERDLLAHDVRVLERRTMTADLPAYGHLVDKMDMHGIDALTADEVRDLQVLYTLAWTGPVHRHQEPFASLIRKGAGFSPADQQRLFDGHAKVMAAVVPTMRSMQHDGQLEVSVTPFHHPILPLLCSTDTALQCSPDATLPAPPFEAAGDAAVQVTRAIDDAEIRFGVRPRGMWPAEGAISMAALDIMVRAGLRWTASDDAVLRRSLGDLASPTSALFPRRVITPSGSIAVLFRDHDLSDAIGFTYASWEPHRAVDDFVRRLEDRRRLIAETHGEEALQHAVVPIMLDGENCWEFYPDNGRAFVTALMQRLADPARFAAVTCSQATAPEHVQAMPDLTHLTAGSWIDGTFDVWIGSPEKNLAWSLLREARAQLVHAMAAGQTQATREAHEHLLVAEGSDWFWWYDDRHVAPHKPLFDVLFRARLTSVYTALQIAPPDILTTTLYDAVATTNTGRVAISYGGSAMHESDLIARDVRLEQSGDWQRVVMSLRRRPTDRESLTLIVTSTDGTERRCHVHAEGVLWHSPMHDEGAHYLSDLEVAVYLHAERSWNVDVLEERGSVRTFTTVLSSTR